MSSAPCHRSAPDWGRLRPRLVVGWLLLATLIACEARPPEPAGARPVPSAATTTAAVVTTAATPATPRDDPAFERAAGISYLLEHHGGAALGDTVPLVIAIHGLGDRPERFGVLRRFDARVRVVLPRGLDPYQGGWSWFDILGRDRQDAEVAAGIARAADKLAALLSELERRYPTRGKPIVTGFSQGGILSFALAVRHPDSIALAVPLSGYLPRSLWPKAGASTFVPVVALHGEADPLLRIEPTRETVGALREAGYSAQLIEYPGVGHTVSGSMLRELVDRLQQAIAEPPQP